MPVYDVGKLMEETRRLASSYRLTTGQVLPVSNELARFDAIRLLGLTPAEEQDEGIDAYSGDDLETKIQIKARVIFDKQKSGQRVGQLKMGADWDTTLLVLFDEHYMSQEIFSLTRSVLLAKGNDKSMPNKRGSMTISKFKALGKLVWQREGGDLASTGEGLHS